MVQKLLLLFIITIQHGYCGRILVVPAHFGSSHTKSMYPFAGTLAKHGHTVVVLQITKYGDKPGKAPAGSNIEDKYLTVPLGPNETHAVIPADLMWKKSLLSSLVFPFPWLLAVQVCKDLLEDEALKKEYEAIVEQKWDVVIVDDIFTPCGMLAAKEARLSGAAIVTFGTTILMPQSHIVRGSPVNMALYPSILRQSTEFDHRTYLGRLANAADFISFHSVELALDYMIPYRLGLPRSEYTAPSLFAQHSDLLMNSISPFLEFVKPLSKDILELDTDCPPKAQLPENYQSFVNDPGSKGTIVLAMGHGANWDGAPRAVTQSFMEAFARLSDYRIVWQYVTKKKKPDVPAHVILDGWVPQSALLYHPKTKLFISHCGAKSQREAICAAVPILALPLIAEQYKNAAAAHWKGISLSLDKANLSTDTVYAKITEIITTPSYEKNVKTLHRQLDDRIIQPMELGRFWTEFLIRHSRTQVQKYFHMSAPKRSWHERSNMDVLSFGIVIVVIMLSTLMT